MNDVRFGYLGFHQHGAHIRQGQDVRRLLRGDDRLALQGGDLRHFPGHWRNDLRVIEVGFRRIQRGLIPFDLRIDGANLRLLHRQLRGGGVQILFRDGLGFRQRLLARQGDLSEITLRLSLRALRAQLHQLRFHFADLVLRLLRIDHPKQLAFFNLIANLN